MLDSIQAAIARAALGLLLISATACREDALSSSATFREPAPTSTTMFEARSLRGHLLFSPPIDPDRYVELSENLRAAERDLDAAPRDEDAWIWVGRRLSYLGRYRSALEAYTRALEIHPESHRLLRHRGHRYITVRRFDLAVNDLARAAELAAGVPDEVEPDGAPNEAGIPTSTTKSNIYYHLGLAHYLRAEYEEALGAYRACLGVSRTHDMRVAAAYWTYLTLKRLGRDEEAAELARVDADLPILENHAYHDLLQHFGGTLSADEVLAGVEPGSTEHATRAYGLACEHLWRGEESAAWELIRRILANDNWPAFGFIAAEADAFRLEIPVDEVNTGL